MTESNGFVTLTTSGTTGEPKTIRLPLAGLREHAKAVNAATGFDVTGLWLSCLPVDRVAGLAVKVRAEVAGARAEIAPRFDAAHMLKRLRSGDVTHCSIVGRMLYQILEADPDSSDPFPPELKCVLVGGGPIAPALLDRAREAGLPVRVSYGLTEAGSTVAIDGIPIAGTEVRLSSEGEILVNGPVTPGWVRTGDLGRIEDDGRLVVLDRRVNLIVSGGENVIPSEVEARLLDVPGVRDVCVVGIPDEVWGHKVAAMIDGETHEVEAWALEHLSAAQRPRIIVQWPYPLPYTAQGKLRRGVARAALLQWLSERDRVPERR